MPFKTLQDNSAYSDKSSMSLRSWPVVPILEVFGRC